MYHKATERYSRDFLHQRQPPPPAYQLKIVRRVNGEVLSKTIQCPTLAGLHIQQGKIMARAEELGQAISTTAIVNGQSRQPRISSQYRKIWEGMTA